MRYKKMLIALLVASMLIFTAACTSGNNGETTKGEDDGKFVIGISLLYRQDEYYKDLEATFINTAEKYGFELKIQDANLDLAKQISQIEDFVTMGVDAIAFAPVDASGVVPAVEEAMDKGIPVFVFDSRIESDVPVSQITFDLYNDGSIMADWALDYIDSDMGGKCNIAILDFAAEPNGSVIRSNGFQETIEKAGKSDIKIVTRQDGEASRTASMEKMENILTAHSEVNMVFGINFDTCAGAKAACVSAGREDIVVVGLGWGVEAFEALENDDPMYKSWFVPAPTVLAENTFDVMSAYLKGEDVPESFEGQSFILDASNIDEYDWRAIVALRK
ncbi:MAG: substrate-binding domain-containing protein [Eubacteriales bacterium]|nr:substrate-binding domain-containing protein [Eubacteriales bacterium]